MWIGWTFTLGFLNWAAFVYIGIRAKQRKWLIWGGLYSIPFLVVMSTPVAETDSGWIGDLWIGVFLIAWVVSIVHAFIIRREYLQRLETLSQQNNPNGAMRERTASGEHNQDVQEIPDPKQFDENTNSSTPASMLRASLNLENAESSSTSSKTHDSSEETEIPQTVGTKPSSVEYTDELEYQISSSYPFPVAFGFRALKSIVDPRDLYREQLRVSENLLAFLGSVSLAILREQDREESEIDPKDYWLTGISPGDWTDIVARCSKVFAGYEQDTLALKIKELKVRSEKKNNFGANIMALIRAKNDYKHDRGPTILEDIADTSEEVQRRLRRCMESLAFLAEYPIRQVGDFDVNRRGGGVTLKCLRYMGDHPSFPQEEVVFHQALRRGDLFLDRGQPGWVPLFPFVTTMTCSRCKVRETYFVDAWDTRKGIARMKSFERGHVMQSTEVSEALAEWVSSS